jgi:hypothetical protein
MAHVYENPNNERCFEINLRPVYKMQQTIIEFMKRISEKSIIN